MVLAARNTVAVAWSVVSLVELGTRLGRWGPRRVCSNLVHSESKRRGYFPNLIDMARLNKEYWLRSRFYDAESGAGQFHLKSADCLPRLRGILVDYHLPSSHHQILSCLLKNLPVT